jgi:FKBP-type peptidyl-prolyl cis-trans isomerase
MPIRPIHAVPLVLAAALGLTGCTESRHASASSASSSSMTSSTTAHVTTPATPAAPESKVHKLADGLVYEDLVVGDGKMADPGLTVSVHYTGWLTDGTKFDSSLDRGEPIKFTLGAHSVIPGWEEGIKGLRVGGKRKLTIPPDLAYGPDGRPPVIPPNATLVFEVQLVAVE